MKKIGILTLYYHNENFGGLLQAYALQRAISALQEDLGIECEQISYELTRTPIVERLKNAQNYSSKTEAVRKIQNEIFNKSANIVLKGYMQKKLEKRKINFENFQTQIPHSSKVYSSTDFNESICDYDTYIVGSDQIWNGGVDLEAFTLGMISDNCVKIAYAASSGGLTYKGKQKEIMQRALRNFTAISVREDSLAKQLADLKIQNTKCVIDPVFLIPREEWKKQMIKPKPNKPYLLCYLLGTSIKQRKHAQTVADKLGLELLTFPYIANNAFQISDIFFGKIRNFESGPLEFLGLLEGAEAVLTDSFHAVAFSVIFNKKYCVFQRYADGKISRSNSRIVDFLNKIGDKNRIVNNADECLTVLANSKVNEQIEKKYMEFAEESKKWLKNALNAETDMRKMK